MQRSTLLFASLGLVLAASGCIVVADETPLAGWYDVCGYDSDCPVNADGCFDVSVDYGSVTITDAICSGYCSGDFDCPFGGSCLSLAGESAVCYQRCDSDFECPLGFACLETDDGTVYDYVCLPN
jgi:hypothetical protein